jgi:adenine-specific DNA-methyltransferase
MATGIPNSGPTPLQTTGTVTLAYPGKQSLDEILRTPPARPAFIPQLNSTCDTPAPNRLYYGENLGVLAHLREDPTVRGQVRLIYIDPPYATRSVFHSRKLANAYDDLLAGPSYLEFLRERLIFLRELLAEDGSIYVHLDENMAFQAKVLMDEVFGAGNFRNWITRKKCNPKNYTRKTYGNVSDYILFYTKSDNYVWHRAVDAWTDEHALREYTNVEADTGRRFKKVPIHAPGARNGATGQPWRGMNPPPGKHWQYLPTTLDEMDARGEIYWSPTGNPRRKIYLDASAGVPVQDIWTEFRDAHNQNIHITGYPTEKNPALLERIINASSNPGDLVLDCFAGSGTTLEVAHRLNRQWLGIDNSPESLRTILRRFSHGSAPMGDFMTAPVDPSPTAELSLFPDTPVATTPGTATITHDPIVNFTLYATPEMDRAGLEPHHRFTGSTPPLPETGETKTRQACAV